MAQHHSHSAVNLSDVAIARVVQRSSEELIPHLAAFLAAVEPLLGEPAVRASRRFESLRLLCTHTHFVWTQLERLLAQPESPRPDSHDPGSATADAPGRPAIRSTASSNA